MLIVTLKMCADCPVMYFEPLYLDFDRSYYHEKAKFIVHSLLSLNKCALIAEISGCFIVILIEASKKITISVSLFR